MRSLGKVWWNEQMREMKVHANCFPRALPFRRSNSSPKSIIWFQKYNFDTESMKKTAGQDRTCAFHYKAIPDKLQTRLPSKRNQFQSLQQSKNASCPSYCSDIRRKTHASAGPSDSVESVKFPKGPKGNTWSNATIVQNKAVSLDGSLRILVISVEDKVVYLEGRSMPTKQERPRWADCYKVPGQFVALRTTQDSADSPAPPQSLHPLASSPYAVHTESADLDASIIEVLLDRGGSAMDGNLAERGPGYQLQVSNVVGQGYASLFNSYVGLLSALEESRSLILIGAGARGMGSLRAVLEWTPVQAHATAHRVALIYACASPASAAFLKDWDTWREAGIMVQPAYMSSSPSETAKSPEEDHEAMQTSILEAIKNSGNLQGLTGGKFLEAAVLISGLPGAVTAAVSRHLTLNGIARERVMFCDYL